MSHWKEVVNHITADAENVMDELRYRMYYALGGPGPVKIITYRGYGTPERIYLRGRVIEDQHIPEAEQNDNIWENMLNMYRRLESDEVPHARLVARFQGIEQEVVANEEGFFEIEIHPKLPLAPRRLWHSVEVELLDPIPALQTRYPIRTMGEVLVPPPSAKFIIISDIDDTVLQSDATHLLKMARTVFLGNAYTRLPFPGVAALYRALYRGKAGDELNPPFYVSSSPWNLYDLLAQFFTLQRIPIGPVLFLRDWGLTEREILPVRQRDHKMTTIRQMLDFYPNLPFILVGDSGQEDPEIYADLVSLYPKRILAVYIRNVSRDLKRPEAIRELAKKVVEAGSSLVLADDSVAIAKHAIDQGFIHPDSLPAISVEKNKDQAPPTPVEKLLGEEVKKEAPTVQIEGKPSEVKQAVKEGVVEEVVKETGRDETKKPPTVVVEANPGKNKKRNK